MDGLQSMSLPGSTVVLADDVGLTVYWVRAIKQHYGPGTEYLDVSRSPEVAVWFALHRGEPEEAVSLSPQDLDRMIRSYYRARGWADDGSVPTERAAALGLTPLESTSGLRKRGRTP